MPLLLIQPLPVGNAMRVLYLPPVGAVEWVVLRNESGVFAAHDDPLATPIMQSPDRFITDLFALTNGTTYHYQSFWSDGSEWHAETVKTGTPATNYLVVGTDPLLALRDRIDLGLQAAVAAGTLQHPKNHIAVLTAPPMFEDTVWPVVTVHLGSDAPDGRALGEDIEASEMAEGWHARAQISVIGWTLNPDERIALRMAIKNVLIANLPVFDALGLYEITFSQSDQEDFQSYNAPVYQTVGQFSCIAPVAVVDTETGDITDVVVTVG